MLEVGSNICTPVFPPVTVKVDHEFNHTPESEVSFETS